MVESVPHGSVKTATYALRPIQPLKLCLLASCEASERTSLSLQAHPRKREAAGVVGSAASALTNALGRPDWTAQRECSDIETALTNNSLD